MVRRFCRSLLPCFLLLFLVIQSSAGHQGVEEEEEKEDQFFTVCHPQNKQHCGSIEIRYPFRLESYPPYCGAPGMTISCSGSTGQPVLSLPTLGSCEVTAIDYGSGIITVKLPDNPWSNCPLQILNSTKLTTATYQPAYGSTRLYLVIYSKNFPENDVEEVAGPITCLSSEGSFVYAVAEDTPMDILPAGFQARPTDGEIPEDNRYTWKERVENLTKKREVDLNLTTPEMQNCTRCRQERKVCGFRRTSNQTFCHHVEPHGPRAELIEGLSIGGFILLASAAAVAFYIIRKSGHEKRIRLKVEKFLATYGDAKPTRYSFDDIRKITKRFKNKLGQGGYGSVYKGELPNGIPVAIKLLERSKGEGEEFINEVATIGKIHHVNVVRLLGFCSERSTRALVYEFMPNESLEKYIFSREDKHPFGVEKLLDIAVGIARGIEYLHQGCQQRILHFDIKPHNILLDHEFNPKISDFGLAKLCSKEQSIVTMTAARGTMGYIAPEMYSRNFGTVSYKSDVYSFGMLVLEMIGGRKNLDPEIGQESQVYYPEWVYERLIQRQDLELAVEVNGREEEEVVKKLAIVALWCIQWSPMDRPTMSRVLQMLTGSLESLQMPPKPFVSSSVVQANESIQSNP